MSETLGHKQQLALAVLKGKKVVLQKIQAQYEERWKVHAFRQGIKTDIPPRTVYRDIIYQEIDEINKEILKIEGGVGDAKK